MHTILSHETQPFVYSSYTIFVAEVPSTLNEALLLEYLLARTTDPTERIVLLQHAIDNITGTFYTQVLFADYELRVAPARGAGSADHGRDPDRDLHHAAEGLLRRRGRPDAANRDHVGPHPALLQLTVLRLSVRDLFRLGGADRAGRSCAVRRRSRRRRATATSRSSVRVAAIIRWRCLKKAGIDLSQPDTVLAIVRPARRSGRPARTRSGQPAQGVKAFGDWGLGTGDSAHESRQLGQTGASATLDRASTVAFTLGASLVRVIRVLSALFSPAAAALSARSPVPSPQPPVP